MPLRCLVSVRDSAEAAQAAAAGVDFVDLKDPAAGALGALPLQQVRELSALLRSTAHAARPAISATVGDLPLAGAAALAALLQQARAVAGCGVDYVKVGIPGDPLDADVRAAALAALRTLAVLPLPGARPAQIVPVFIIDQGLDMALVGEACALGFALQMLDTSDKGAGSLLQRLGLPALRGFIAHVRAAGGQPGLAGALRLQDVPALRQLAPAFAGFRSAVCEGPRSTALCPQRLQALLQAMRCPPLAVAFQA